MLHCRDHRPPWIPAARQSASGLESSLGQARQGTWPLQGCWGPPRLLWIPHADSRRLAGAFCDVPCERASSEIAPMPAFQGYYSVLRRCTDTYVPRYCVRIVLIPASPHTLDTGHRYLTYYKVLHLLRRFLARWPCAVFREVSRPYLSTVVVLPTAVLLGVGAKETPGEVAQPSSSLSPCRRLTAPCVCLQRPASVLASGRLGRLLSRPCEGKGGPSNARHSGRQPRQALAPWRLWRAVEVSGHASQTMTLCLELVVLIDSLRLRTDWPWCL